MRFAEIVLESHVHCDGTGFSFSLSLCHVRARLLFYRASKNFRVGNSANKGINL